MKNKFVACCFILVSLFLTSCKNQKEEQATDKVGTEVKEEQAETNPDTADFAEQETTEAWIEKIKQYLATEYLSPADLRAIKKDQRKFQVVQIDLNQDGEKEIFINFVSSYFCGSGGCTLLLLNKQLEPITEFTVTQTPI